MASFEVDECIEAADRIEALEAKLAKVVEALEKIAGVKGPYSHPFPEASEGYGAFAIVTSRATLAEIKGESHEALP
jgi:hypothetical protein